MRFLRSGRIRSAFQGLVSACLLLSQANVTAGDHGGWGMTLLRPWKPGSHQNCDPQQKPHVRWLMSEKKLEKTNPFIRKAVEYPVISPHCSPNFGHYQTRWSSFPEGAGDPYCSLLSPVQYSTGAASADEILPMPVPATPEDGALPEDAPEETEGGGSDPLDLDSPPELIPADEAPTTEPSDTVEGASYRPAKLPLLLRKYAEQNGRGIPDGGSSLPVSEVFGLSPIPEMSVIRK